MNPVKAFLAAIEPLRGVPTPVLCETCGIVRPRISHSEADTLIALGRAHKPRRLACRTKRCDGWAYLITADDLFGWWRP